MASRTPLIRASIGGGLVAVLAVAYFLGGVRSPDRVAATPTQTQPSGAAQADTASVAGVGRIAGTPDTLQLQLAVESHGADVSKALGAAGASLTKVSESLKAHSVATADLKTSGLDVRPNYRYDNKGTPTLIDYIATESLTVKLRNIDKAGEAISAAVAAGGNDARLNGVSLDLEGNADLVKEARGSAFADAKAKAEQYAKLAGRELGAVVSVTENSQDSPPVPMYAASAAPAMDGARSVPIERGSQEVAVSVQVVWALK